MRNRNNLLLLLISLSSRWSAGSLASQASSDGFEVRAGCMNAKSSTTLDLSGSQGDGEIDIENLLNIDDSSDSIRLGFAW
jgi:hypothetical protein